MEYSVDDLIGMLNLSIIIAKGNSKGKVEIPKDGAIEMVIYLNMLKELLS